MTDIDTTRAVVPRAAGPHPATGPGSLAARPDAVSDVETSVDDGAPVVLLNDAAAIYEALASEIAGTAVGWSADALAQLERGLLQRYGALVGGRHPVRRLVRLASRPVGR